MSIPLHVKFRRTIKVYADRVLKYFSPKPSLDYIPRENINNILLIRINYRIGNMLFITPMLEQLQDEFPDAKIDVLLGAPFTKVLFEGFKNVENIYDFDRKLLKEPLEAFAYINKLRSKQYDVVFNVNGGSASDRFATLLAKSTYKVAFCDDYSYSPVNRCVKREDVHINHEALKPMELLKIFDLKPNYDLKLTLSLSEDELKAGKDELNLLLNYDEEKKYFGIFRNARYDKKLDDIFWKNLTDEIEKLDKNVVFVDILSPDIPKKLNEKMYEYSNKNLRALASFVANLDAFICADTGPMHLASASGVPTIALFQITAPLMYGTLKERDLSLVIKEKTVDEIAKSILEHIKG